MFNREIKINFLKIKYQYMFVKTINEYYCKQNKMSQFR